MSPSLYKTGFIVELSEVVPWGRSLTEYRRMFSLSNDDLRKKILGCGDGPACFNAELSRAGGNVISVDPIYQFNADQIRLRIDEVYPQIMAQVSKNQGDYVWKNIPDPEALGNIRMTAMRTFLSDYESAEDAAEKTGRYVNAALPTLPFDDAVFDLALCSHYLFLYSEHVNKQQHMLSMKELCRVANEVRVYPLLTLGNNKRSPHLDPVIKALEDDGMTVSLLPVEYEFQKGATEMLVAKTTRLESGQRIR